MIYKIAVIDDYTQIINMKNRVKKRIENEKLPIWLNGYPTDDLIMEDIVNNYGRVIKINNKVVAYAYLIPTEIEYGEKLFKKDNLNSFGRVMVDDDYLRSGMGIFLIKNLIEETKKSNKNGLGITADEFNIKAINLYNKFGFKKEGEKQFPYAYLSIYGLYFSILYNI